MACKKIGFKLGTRKKILWNDYPNGEMVRNTWWHARGWPDSVSNHQISIVVRFHQNEVVKQQRLWWQWLQLGLKTTRIWWWCNHINHQLTNQAQKQHRSVFFFIHPYGSCCQSISLSSLAGFKEVKRVSRPVKHKDSLPAIYHHIVKNIIIHPSPIFPDYDSKDENPVLDQGLVTHFSKLRKNHIQWSFSKNVMLSFLYRTLYQTFGHRVVSRLMHRCQVTGIIR